MNRPINAALAFLVAFTLSLTVVPTHAVENTWDYSVQVSSVVQASPAKVTLSWPQDTNGTPSSYTIYRRTPGSTSWGSGTALSGSTTSYSDSNVTSGNAYEYRIVKASAAYTGYGYITAGVNAPLVDSRGKVVLVVDNSIASSLTSELARLEQDLTGDGWTVVRRGVGRNDSVGSVKSVIKSVYDSDPANVKSVFLFGHIPVPYSGQLNPDGHPDHVGAWPADAFYGDMDGNWTDSSVNYSQTLNTDAVDAARMSNKPGDGKFDQTQLPSAIELEVGRVDLANMPGRTTWGGSATFPTEVELLRNYLNKDHNFRHRITTAPRRALVGDYFGQRGGEAFAASGFRSFAPLVGASNVRNLNVEFNDQKGVWIPQAAKNDYLLTYACGAGSYTTIGGLGSTGIYNDGSTTEMVSNNVRGVFNLIFGSWLGDWDHEDNMLRSPLATSTGLAAVWSGRPHWFMHPLGTGETLGYTARLAMNNSGDYQTQINSAQNRIHIALMGDPTLRLHPVAPVGAINGSIDGSSVALSWGASNDSALIGCHVYRSASPAGPFTRVTSSPVSGTSFTDTNGSPSATYMVRAIKLESSPSGTYENASQGVFWSSAAGSSSTAASPVATAPASDTGTTATSGGTPSTPPSTSTSNGSNTSAGPGTANGSPATPAPGGVTTGGNAANVVTVVAVDPTAVIGTSDTATVKFARTGSIASDLVVNYDLSGSAVKWVDYRREQGDMPVAVTIPAGSSSTSISILAIANATGTSEPTALFTLAGDPGYAVGAESSATVTLSLPGTATVSNPPSSASPILSGSLPMAETHSVTLPTPTTPSMASSGASDTVWFDDALPIGASGGASGGDTWLWSANNPPPFSGTVSHQSSVNRGLHEHYFNWASVALNVAVGEKLFVYVYLDPANMPSELMVSWCSTNWEHRAFWGADNINSGKKNTVSRHYAGALPPAGQWVRLEVPASAVGLEGAAIHGMNFALFDGSASWDLAGKSTGSIATTPATSNPAPTTTVPNTATEFVWIDDAVPTGGRTGASGGDSWKWVSSNPAPFTGTQAHQSTLAAGLHEHFFNWGTPMNVATGDTLFTYVYLDAENLPSEIMLSFVSDNWEHRAYWGADKIANGTNGTASRRYVGALPAAGAWVRLEVPASAVGLEGAAVTGMSFSTFDGRATFDKTGKATPGTGAATTSTASSAISSSPSAPTVTIAATDARATIASSTDNAVVTFTRTGDTSASLLVKYTLGGSAVKWVDYRRVEGDMPVEVTIPAGAVSTTMTIAGIANVANANPATAVFTLSPDATYTVGSANVAALTIASSSASSSGSGTSASGGFFSPGAFAPPPTVPAVPVPTTPVVTAPTTPTTPTAPTTPFNAASENSVTRLPQVGDYALRIVSPTVLELQRITTKDADPAPVSEWNFISNGTFNAPATSEFAVTVNGQASSVKAVNFRRRVAYAPLYPRDLRIDNVLILELNSAIADDQAVEVKNPSGALWPASMPFKLAANPLRYSPAIHVNQEGYVPSFPKKAIVGYYLGNKGELEITATTFKIVTAATGTTVFTGNLTARKETGYTYSPQPYQKVLQADFSSFTTPGEYQLVVAGLGASLPFLIDEGIAMAFTRTYALGLYHQRSGVPIELPYTRFTHGAGHTAAVEIPSPQSSFGFTWTTIASKNGDAKNNPRHTAPQLKDEASQLYPFVNKGTVAANGGHMDAGDYSKYTINSAHLTHLLMFSADAIAGAGALDNLGLPESGDGKSDLMQEAKIESDFISKLQDADGGFYFIVYPKNRAYENNVTPAGGDSQVVWPKNTSATAASVAALAQMASSPKFKAAYPAEATAYLAKAKAGWTFLMNAIAKHGKDGSYQKVTFYGDNYLHDDELAWAACELFLATGEAQYHTKLMEFFPDPSNGATMRWGWWRMSEAWGNAIRSYAFSSRTGRLGVSQLNATYLAKCEEQVKLAGDDALSWTNKSAYPTAFPQETKNVQAAGWYFSLDQASDMATAYQLNPKAEYLDALVGNMNYEAGTNPVNMTYLTGLGVKRQREIVSQWAVNDRQSLPMIGIPIGNVQSSFDYLSSYGAQGNELSKLSFPSDDNSAANRYPFYDRWADTWNVTTEFVTVNQARSMVSVSMLAGLTATKSQAWKPSQTATIVVPTGVAPVGQPVTLSLTGVNVAGARITWEARDQQPDFGSTYRISPKNNGVQWVEAEVVFADGRRIFATGTFTANSPVSNWIDDALPIGTSIGGNEPWLWVSSPTMSGTKAHQSSINAGIHEHAFMEISTPLEVGVGDKLFVNVYLDPAAMPEAIMLSWNDGTWEHRAFWGADKINYGTFGTASRFRVGELPAGGQWVRLEVPASAVALEGRTVKGMSFSAFGGRVTWDVTGKTSPTN